MLVERLDPGQQPDEETCVGRVATLLRRRGFAPETTAGGLVRNDHDVTPAHVVLHTVEDSRSRSVDHDEDDITLVVDVLCGPFACRSGEERHVEIVARIAPQRAPPLPGQEVDNAHRLSPSPANADSGALAGLPSCCTSHKRSSVCLVRL